MCFTGATAAGRRVWKSGEGSLGPVAYQQGIYWTQSQSPARYVHNHMVWLSALVFKRFDENCLSNSSNFMNTPGKTRQSIQSDARITKLSNVYQWIQRQQHKNERKNPTLAIYYGREITDNPKLCFCPNVELSSGFIL